MNFAKQISEMMESQLRKQLEDLSALYGFDKEDAKLKMNLSNSGGKERDEIPIKKEKKVAVSKKREEDDDACSTVSSSSVKKEKKEKGIELPFCGQIREGCFGVVPNGGLYTQCCKEVKDKVRTLCGACSKQAEKNEYGIPDNGLIQTRQDEGLYEFKTSKGKKPTPYMKIMEEKGWTREKVVEFASSKGIVIPEEHFSKAISSKAAKSSESKPKRGRPKEEAKELVINQTTGGQTTPKSKTDELEEEHYEAAAEEEEVELECVEFEHKDGKKYFRDERSGKTYTKEGHLIRLY